MGHPDGAHTHGSGGNGLPEVVLVVLAVAVVATVVGPGRRRRVALRAHDRGRVIVGIGVAAVAGLLASRWRSWKASAARTTLRFSRRWCGPHRRLLQARRANELPAESQRELPGGLHLHFHGVRAEDIAAILVRETLRDRR
jgi:hypothetical protein